MRFGAIQPPKVPASAIFLIAINARIYLADGRFISKTETAHSFIPLWSSSSPHFAPSNFAGSLGWGLQPLRLVAVP